MPEQNVKRDWPFVGGQAVTPHDTTKFTKPARGLYVGTGGTVVVVMDDDTVLTLVNVPDGTLLPLSCYRVNNTSTTASNIVAFW